MHSPVHLDMLPYMEVLRLGHRPLRDKRITTHVSLLSRAFGARGIYIDTSDPRLESTLKDVNRQFGGEFFTRTGQSRKPLLRGWNGTIVHLTMYGAPLKDVIYRIPRDERILVIVGAEKVPRDVFDLSHFNVSVASQPHSEVSALALFMDRLCGGRQLELDLPGGRSRIVPDHTGKKVVAKEDGSGFRDPFQRRWPAVPTREQCMDLLEEVGMPSVVREHLKMVHGLGCDMVKSSEGEPGKMGIETDVLEAGLLLHDLGRCMTHSVRHVDKGFRLSEELGLDHRISLMIRNHIGAGVTEEEAGALGLVPEDHIPTTLMERIVAHADNLVGERRRRRLEEAVEKLEKKGATRAARRMEELHLGLEKELGIDIDDLLYT
ncbi:MAG: HDIG domain-containing protein [Thermoplasmatota archaeon]